MLVSEETSWLIDDSDKLALFTRINVALVSQTTIVCINSQF